MEEVTIIDIEEKETKYKANLAMLLTEANRHGGKLLIKVGAYKMLLKVLDDNLIEEIDK